MSSHDVTMRLRRVSQLRRLCLALARSRPIGPLGVDPIAKTDAGAVLPVSAATPVAEVVEAARTRSTIENGG